MSNHEFSKPLTRRDLLKYSAVGAAAVGAEIAFTGPVLAAAVPQGTSAHPHSTSQENLYAELLRTWCDGLIAHQETGIHDPTLRGGFLCPACVLVHGRCGDAVYPLLRMAHTTGDAKYLNAALQVHDWSERRVSRADGSWINDVTLSSWQGITVFHAIALAEALHHHGTILDSAVRRSWTDRLARAAKFLDGLITMETGNINYPVTASLCFALCGQVLGDSHYADRAQKLAHDSLDYFSTNNFLYGEGHPLRELSAKHCRPVDLGYNVEESLPALALYATLTDDKPVLDQTIAALRTHMEFMLPDGGWDNSWGTRNYKWSWWGSRTSDGCHPAYVLLAKYEPKFLEVAQRNLELMSRCTHNGLLYGGPEYFAHGDLPCIHHSFTHAKALATVLDRGGANLKPAVPLALPRDEAYGLKTFPEIGTRLAAIGEWRATVTEYDWEYAEHVQAGGGSAGGGHATGGALSLLYHRALGPILVASMTEYQMIEISNQQAFGDYPHMTLTPRIESVGKPACTSISDFTAVLTATATENEIVFDAKGRLLTASRHALPGRDPNYELVYNLSAAKVEITATASGDISDKSPLQYILPIISTAGEVISRPDAKTIRIKKSKGALLIHVDSAHGIGPLPTERTFNLVPGFECIPITVPMQPGVPIRIQIEADQTSSS